MKRMNWATRAKLWMAELASILSLPMLLVWVLMHEFDTLFRR